MHIQCWWNWHLGSISSTIYLQLLRSIIPKCIKIQLSHKYLFTLLGSTGAKAARRTLMKLTPDYINVHLSFMVNTNNWIWGSLNLLLMQVVTINCAYSFTSLGLLITNISCHVTWKWNVVFSTKNCSLFIDLKSVKKMYYCIVAFHTWWIVLLNYCVYND